MSNMGTRFAIIDGKNKYKGMRMYRSLRAAELRFWWWNVTHPKLRPFTIVQYAYGQTGRRVVQLWDEFKLRGPGG